jgi:hypothetical protein
MPSHLTPHQRFWAKVDKNGPVPQYAPHLGQCWLWMGWQDRQGYGHFWDGKRIVLAHRWAYEQARGPIVIGLESDHLCRTPACVRLRHLEAVTRKQNQERGSRACQTHCIHGHPFDEANTYYRPDKWQRSCRACNRLAVARSKERRAVT